MTLKYWKEIVTRHHHKSSRTPSELDTAQQLALNAYKQRVDEMARRGQGVKPHDSVNDRTIIRTALETIANGKEHIFSEIVAMV